MFVTKEELAFYIKALESVKEERSKEEWGICDNLSEVISLLTTSKACSFKNRLNDKFQKIRECDTETWENYSGDYIYPIPSVYESCSAGDCYTNIDLWKGEYGKLRFELLDHLINTAKLRLEEMCNG